MNTSQGSEGAPSTKLVRCVHTGETVPVTDCIEIGGQMVQHKFKDQYVEALRQGVVSAPTLANIAGGQPKAVFWAGVFFSAAPFQLYLAYRGLRDSAQLYSAVWSFTQPSLFLASAILIWSHGRRRLTYYVATFALVLSISRGLWSQIFPDPRFPGVERLMIPGLLLTALLLWRFTFGEPSRSYFGFRKPL